MLYKQKDYSGLYESLYNFKKEQAENLVTIPKIQSGLYSPKAEAEKISNEFVKHFALYDSENKKFLASMQLFFHDDLINISDLIVTKSLRHTGLASALLVKAFETLQAKHLNVRGVWFIPPEDNELMNFYENKLQSFPLSFYEQENLGLRVLFLEPRHDLLKAANREMKRPYFSKDNESSFLKYGLFAAAATVTVAVVAAGCTLYLREPSTKP